MSRSSLSIAESKDNSISIKGGGGLHGTVRVPGDKSISHRSLLFGSISNGSTQIKGLLPAEDPISTANCLRAMGVNISKIEPGKTVHIEGLGLDGLKEPNQILNCGNSGTTMRLLLGLLVGREGRHFVLTGDQSLCNRPMRRVGKPLEIMGAQVRGRKKGNLAPLSIFGEKLHGAVIGTPVASAQIKSAILLAALTANGTTTVIEPAQSRDHSERMLKAFGANLEVGGEMGRHIIVKPGASLIGQEVVVPGDISSAAFWLIAGTFCPESNLLIENIGLNPTRTGILEVMKQMGAKFEILNKKEVAGEPVADIKIKNKKETLSSFKINGEMIPRLVDEIPILTVAACFCEGKTEITGASELRVKETDRLAVMTRQLKAMGAEIEEHKDGLTIIGGGKLKGTNVNSETDHRVAMSLGIASFLASGESLIKQYEAASVSYPDFWKDFERLRN